MSRPSKLTESLLQQLEALLSAGCSIDDACAQVNVTKQTFYNWKKESLRLQRLGNAHPRLPITDEDARFLTFFDRVTRAQARARVMAVMAVRTGLVPTEQVEVVTETITETRLRRNAGGEDVPYEYRRTITKRTVREIPPDWRAGIEFLKRRMPAEWSDRIKVETWQDRAVADIRAGTIEFEALAEAFDESLAAELFARAGVPVPSEQSEG